MEYRYLDWHRLYDLSVEIFRRYGYKQSDCETIADVILMSDRFGIESHGVQRLIMYTTGIQLGRIDRNAVPEVLFETPVSAVVDGHQAFGQTVGRFAMEKAMEKARQTGVGMVTVRNSNHYGIAGYYADMAAREGMIGISMTNTEALVVPTFGKQPMLGTNPIAVSIPAKPHPWHMDESTSVIPAGKFEVYAKLGKELPAGCLIDAQGKASLDPTEFIRIRAAKSDGGIFPLGGEGETTGGHKGYGLSTLVEIFCGILSCGRTSNYIRVKPDSDCTSHFFMAIDHGVFGDKAEIEEGLERYLDELRSTRLADGQTRIYTHGDKAYANLERTEREGIKVNAKTYQEILDICRQLDLDPKSYLIEKHGEETGE